MFAMLLGHARVMRAIAAPAGVRAAAEITLQHSNGLQGAVTASKAGGPISMKTNAHNASHITLLQAAAASIPGTTAKKAPSSISPRSPRATASSASLEHSRSQVSIPSVEGSASTDDLVSNLMEWVSVRQHKGRKKGPAVGETSPEQALRASRSTLLLKSVASRADMGSSSLRLPLRLHRVESQRWLSSSQPQPGEETVLVDLKGLRRYDTWGFCDCVLGAGVDLRQEAGNNSTAATISQAPLVKSLVASPPPTRPVARAHAPASNVVGSGSGSSASVSRAMRTQQQLAGSSGSLAPAVAAVMDPLFEPRVSPLHTILIARTMGDGPLRSPRRYVFRVGVSRTVLYSCLL
jgi:hypothetical protein